MVPVNLPTTSSSILRKGQSLPAMRRVMGLPAESHDGVCAIAVPTSSTSEQSAIPIRNKRSEIELPIATDETIAELLSEKLSMRSDNGNNGRKSSMSSPFKRKARKSISFGVVEIQQDEESDGASADEEDAPEDISII